jgi:methylase of polypeptide subunit release factors
MLRQQFDIVPSNPPWVAYRDVTDPRLPEETKRRAVEQYRIAPTSQTLFTHMELATVFLAHSMKVFAREGCKQAQAALNNPLSGRAQISPVNERTSALRSQRFSPASICL